MNTGRTLLLGLTGALIGGAIGYLIFGWLTRQGFYALLLPPATLGLGAGLLARHRSPPLAMICAGLALALGLFTEWRFAPFAADDSLSYFLSHLHHLRPLTGILVVIGAILAYRMALGSHRGSIADR